MGAFISARVLFRPLRMYVLVGGKNRKKVVFG